MGFNALRGEAIEGPRGFDAGTRPAFTGWTQSELLLDPRRSPGSGRGQAGGAPVLLPELSRGREVRKPRL